MSQGYRALQLSLNNCRGELMIYNFYDMAYRWGVDPLRNSKNSQKNEEKLT
jgi:hypothetical protein